MSGDERVEDGVGEEYEESAYEVARRLYGRSLEPRNRRELGSADRTFVLAHLAMLRLRAIDEHPGVLCPGEALPSAEDDPTEEVAVART